MKTSPIAGYAVWRGALVLVLAVPLLAGCTSARRALGWEKTSPDEFTVVSRAPLAQPPDFDLRPPAPGTPRPQEGTTVDQARRALLGNKDAESASTDPALADLSAGERALLFKAGADRASPDIRKEVDEESSALIEANKSFTDEILFWQDKPPPGEVLDPAKEQKRLEADASLGKPPTEGGETPLIERKQKGWLEGIF